MNHNLRRLRSHIVAIWLSVLSWMPWRRWKQRRLQEMEELLQVQTSRLAGLVRQEMHEELMTAMVSLEAALTRQDDLVVKASGQLMKQNAALTEYLEDMLTELLNSVQPNPDELIFRALGQSNPLPSAPNSGT